MKRNKMISVVCLVLVVAMLVTSFVGIVSM